jgi:hypothetical protein
VRARVRAGGSQHRAQSRGGGAAVSRGLRVTRPRRSPSASAPTPW